MDFFKKHNLTAANIFKIAGVAIVAIFLLVVAFRLIGTSINTVLKNRDYGYDVYPQSSTGYDYKSGIGYPAMEPIGLSERNIAPVPSTTTGSDAEEYEVTEYYAMIETRELDKTCALITDLKAREDVIFESANEYDQGCNYIFKVKKDSVSQILDIINSTDPKELTESTYTIKNIIEDYTSEIDILEKKLESIDETLNKAMAAYDNITALATRVQDVETLAKIIDSKIAIIERLTQERINVNSQLDMISRSKAVQLDRLEYTYFHVNIIEDKFIDGENLKDAWKAAIKKFVNDINDVAQGVTVTLVTVLLRVVQIALYLLILLVIVKYSWKFIKYFWKK
ncbi:MAG: hypothetical protein ACOZBH_03045 [Patescibacteria group bacterium]